MRRSPKLRGRMALAGLTVGALALLTACGDTGGVGGVDNADQDTSGGEVTLQYWTWFPPDSTLQQLIDAYEDANPNVTIELHKYAGGDYKAAATLALNGGEEIDILGVQVSAMTKDVSPTVRPVSEWEQYLPADWESQLSSTALEQSRAKTDDGNLYAIPMGSIGSAIMYYNAAMLDELGITPPKTADELAAAVTKIKAEKPDVLPAAFIGDAYWQLEMLWTIIGQTNSTLSDDILYHGASWDDPDVIQGLADYKALFASGAFDTATLSLKAPRPVELFGTGDAAFLFDGTFRASLLSENYRKANDIAVADVGALPFPIVHADGQPAVRTGAEGGLAIPKSSKHVEAAAKFIQWMTLGDGVDIWGSQLLLIPTKKDFVVPDGALASDAAKAGAAAIQDVVGRPSSARDDGEFKNFAGNEILNVINGVETPEQAAAKLQAEWTSGRYPHPEG